MNSCERDATGIAGDLNRLTGGMLPGRTVNCAVHTAPRRPTEDFLGSFAGLERGVSANSAGQLTAVLQGFDGPDSSCLGGTQRGDGQKPDGSRTDDRYRFARADGGQAEGMQGDGERLGQPETRASQPRDRMTSFR